MNLRGHNFRYVLAAIVLLVLAVVNADRKCNTRTDLMDEASKAYLSPLVFEAEARSKSSPRHNGIYGVTFDVLKVYKGSIKSNVQIRLQFTRSNSRRPRKHEKTCLVSAHLRTGRKYIVFANEPHSPHNYTVFTSPVKYSRKARRSIKKVLCKKCGKFQIYYNHWLGLIP